MGWVIGFIVVALVLFVFWRSRAALKMDLDNIIELEDEYQKVQQLTGDTPSSILHKEKKEDEASTKLIKAEFKFRSETHRGTSEEQLKAMLRKRRKELGR